MVLRIEPAASEREADGVIVAADTDTVVLGAVEASALGVATWTWFCFKMMLSTVVPVAAAEYERVGTTTELGVIEAAEALVAEAYDDGAACPYVTIG